MSPKSKAHALQPGDKVLHPYNRELGPGLVQDLSGNRMTVEFPKTGSTLQFAVQGHPLVPLTLRPGADPERWLEEFQEGIVERLARLDVEPFEAFRNRLDALHLMRLRESTGLGSFLGGRIEIFPHQLHVAEVATAEHVATDCPLAALRIEEGTGRKALHPIVLLRDAYGLGEEA